MRTATFHPFADRELTDAADYYESRAPGLGVRFLDQIERCIASIRRAPETGRLVGGRVRRRLVRSVPYALLYSVQPDAVRILGVMHWKRQPLYRVGGEGRGPREPEHRDPPRPAAVPGDAAVNAGALERAISRSSTDADYRALLLRDPRQALAAVGIEVPGDVEVRVHECTEDRLYRVIWRAGPSRE